MQHPPGWCDGSHSAPERPPHTSLLVERRESEEVNQCMGIISHDGQRPMGKFGQNAGVTPLLFFEGHPGIFNDHRESGPRINVSSEGRMFYCCFFPQFLSSMDLFTFLYICSRKFKIVVNKTVLHPRVFHRRKNMKVSSDKMFIFRWTIPTNETTWKLKDMSFIVSHHSRHKIYQVYCSSSHINTNTHDKQLQSSAQLPLIHKMDWSSEVSSQNWASCFC